MQNGTDVGVGEGSLDVEDDGNIPSASTSVMSLATPHTELFSRRRVSGSHIPRTLVLKVSICSFSFDRADRRMNSDPETLALRAWVASPRSTYNTLYPVPRRRVGRPHLTSYLRSPSACDSAAHPLAHARSTTPCHRPAPAT